MTRAVSDGLARITVAAPQRRIDIAVPQDIPVVELMGSLIRAAGESAADDGQQSGGWVLRRPDGALIDADRSFGDQQIRDGEILHMVGRFTEWPEVDYDDVVDAIATGARRASPWSGARTHATGMVCGLLLLATAWLWLATSSSDNRTTGLIAVGAALIMLFVGFGFSRGKSGNTGGAVIAATAGIVFASLGGTLALADPGPWSGFNPWQFVLGFGCTLVASVLAITLVGQQTQYFVALAWIGLIGLLCSTLALTDPVEAPDAAAIALAIVTVFTAAYPILSIRLGKLPVPSLPTSADELLADEPQLPLSRVHATVRRADEILTGLLIGTAVITVVGGLIVTSGGTITALIYVAIVACTVLLRARLFPTTRHRVPLLGAGLVTLLMLLVAVGTTLTAEQRTMIGAPAVVVLAIALMTIGRFFADHQPTPYLARIGDILDVLFSLAVIPLMCLAVGLFTYIRGLWG